MKSVPCLGLLLAAAFLPPAFAQVAPAAASSTPARTTTVTKEEEAIQLAPFQVVRANDQGWLVGSTMLGNRTNQSLKDTPITIDALTKEFLMDFGPDGTSRTGLALGFGVK
jgi:hypothetical protein